MVYEILREHNQKELNQKDAARIATEVRDIPYALNADGNIKAIFEDRIAGCTRKHLYLLPRLKQLGYKVAIGLTDFDWRKLPIPDKVLSLLIDPIGYHMFLYYGFERAENVLDVTWDKGMQHLGFPVFDWDGLSATGLTVEGSRTRKINRFVLQARSKASTIMGNINLKDQSSPFNEPFNLWLAEARLTKGSNVIR
ncbi:hypothetical protein L6272_04020 [Microgenomates group bacterium]|nr:hypothetical protein [Microgenomates group bacterium]